MTTKRPEIAFLHTVATAVIDGEPVEAACFVLVTEGKEPYVVQYGELARTPSMLRSIMHNTRKAVIARENLNEGAEPAPSPEKEAD